MKTVVIDRSQWRTGQEYDSATGKGPTRLKNQEGFKCCLGFICEAYGKEITTNDIWKTYPRQMGRVPFLSWFKKVDGGLDDRRDTKLTYAAIEINDSQLPLKTKERKLRQLFKGKINLKFIGEPVPYSESN